MFKSRKIKKNPQSELKLTDANTDISWDNQIRFKSMYYRLLAI